MVFERIGGGEACLGGAAVDIRSLGFEGESSFQNLAEYVGALVGILGFVDLGIRCEDFEIRGGGQHVRPHVGKDREGPWDQSDENTQKTVI